MLNSNPAIEWRLLVSSVQGAKHKRIQQSNQDAYKLRQDPLLTIPLVMAIADGHGSARCFRSEVGAERAVDVAVDELHRFHDLHDQSGRLSEVKRMSEELLPKSMVRNWREQVKAHLAEAPISNKEWAQLVEKEGLSAQREVENNPLLAYGTTIVAVLVTRSYLLYLQLGDGDILSVSEDYEISRPLPKDERFIANETASLSAGMAEINLRLQFQPLLHSPSPPALILLATDGYANSFRDEENFIKAGPDFLKMLRVDGGLEKVRQHLPGWLEEVSTAGSGDDITLGIICRMAAIEGYHERDRAEKIV